MRGFHVIHKQILTMPVESVHEIVAVVCANLGDQRIYVNGAQY